MDYRSFEAARVLLGRAWTIGAARGSMAQLSV